MPAEIREATFLILTALAGGPSHGYAILRDTAELSGNTVKLQASTLYAALERLTVDELVEVASEEVVQGRLRRTFRLTPTGARELAAAATRRRELAQRTLSRLGIATAVNA